MTLPETYKDKSQKLGKISQNGFTLLEVLIALALIFILVAAVAPLYTRLQGSTQLSGSTSELAQTLRTAHTRAASRFNDASHGVYLEASQYTLYQGTSYAGRVQLRDRVIVLDSALTLSSSPQVTDLNFSKGFGTPSSTTTFTLTHEVYGTTTVKIDALGSVQ